MSVNGQTSCGIDEVLADPVALLHKSVEVVSSRMHGHPAGVVSSIGTIDRTDQLKRRIVFVDTAMGPDLVSTEVCRIKVLLLRIKDHSVNTRVRLVRVVLNIFLECLCSGIGGEDSAMASVIVERIAVDGIRRLVRCEKKDGTGICGGKRSIGCRG
jgi:hypothetical protein